MWPRGRNGKALGDQRVWIQRLTTWAGASLNGSLHSGGRFLWVKGNWIRKKPVQKLKCCKWRWTLSVNMQCCKEGCANTKMRHMARQPKVFNQWKPEQTSLVWEGKLMDYIGLKVDPMGKAGVPCLWKTEAVGGYEFLAKDGLSC